MANAKESFSNDVSDNVIKSKGLTKGLRKGVKDVPGRDIPTDGLLVKSNVAIRESQKDL